MNPNIPETNHTRIVIAGGGFAGLKLARNLPNTNCQIVLLDKNNYHQFQPLFYQVSTSGLEPSTISFPFRKIFQGNNNVHIRIAEITSVNNYGNYIISDIGRINYDFLVIATGASTNFYGNKNVMNYALPMKSVTESLELRNRILENYEKALITEDSKEQQALMNVVVVGGGPTGVELSGTLAQMRNHILPKDYPELDFTQMRIYIIETSSKLLNAMSAIASQKAEQYLKKLNVSILTNKSVKDYDGKNVLLSDNTVLYSKNLIWAAGVTCNKLEGIPKEVLAKNNRIKVDEYNRVKGFQNIFAIGDIAFMTEEGYQNGHPQVAQTAIQQAMRLASNLKNLMDKKNLVPFHYEDLGSLATIGKNLAVADLPYVKFQGFFAWLVWMFVHLMAIVGAKNRIFIFINWAWNYVTYDQSLRLIIRTKNKHQEI